MCAAGAGRRRRVDDALVADGRACERVLGKQDVRLQRALDELQEVAHRRDLLALLLQEPVHRLLAHEVALLAGEPEQVRDLLGDALLLLECHAHRLDGVCEVGLRRLNARDRQGDVGVEQELGQHHRVVPLLDRLAVEVRGQVRERLGVVVDRDRDVLLRGGELVADLLVDCVVERAHRGNSIHVLRTLPG